MRVGVRTQLFGTAALLILALGLAGVAISGGQARRILEERLVEDLLAEARLARALVRARSPAEVGEVAAELGRVTGADVILLEGPAEAPGVSALRIVADSRGVGMDRDTLAGLPEVRDAWIADEGTWRGPEPCAEMGCAENGVAVAVRWRGDETTGVVRLHKNLAETEAAVARLRAVVGGAAGLGLALALFMAALASRVLSRTLAEFVLRARAMARGEGGRLAIPDDEALGGLAGSINELGGHLDRTIRDLASERDLLGTVLEGLGDAVLALDGDLRIRVANGASVQMLGLPREPVGLSLLEASRHPDLMRLAVDARASTEGDPSPVEIGLGRPVPRRVLAAAHRLADGGCVLLLRDVTEARRVEALRKDFVGNASHELRTPVAATLASVEALCDGALADPTAGPAFLEAARRNTLRLSRLVEDLLDLSRLDSGTLEIVTRPVALGPVVAEALEGVRSAAAVKGLQMEAIVPPGLSVLAEEGALGQILQNLLDNAVKYTPEGGRITVEAGPAGTRVRIGVRDTGPGVPPQHRDRIFERFYRVDTARSRSLGGTGLGLAIVRHLAERMGGEVTLACPEAGGSVFTVHLPPAP